MGHARALINVEDPSTQLMIYEQVIEYDFSVRKVEEVVRELTAEKPEEPAVKKEKTTMPEEYQKLKKQLSNVFKTNIQFSRSDEGKGKIIIPFRTDEELEKIINILDKINA
jgi:ParB family chromosome partitioning protein